MDEIPVSLEAGIPAAWPIVAATFYVLHRTPEPHPEGLAEEATAEGYRASLFLGPVRSAEWTGDGESVALGTLQLRPSGDNTRLTVETTQPYEPYWRQIVSLLDAHAERIKAHRRVAGELGADAAIEFYYRSRAQGSKHTLRSVAELFNISYEALKKHKQRYDAAGKWGSKSDG